MISDPSEPDRPVLELTGVVFQRGEQRILDDIDFEVRQGEHWVVLGANGSGKTTLLRIASLYEHPSEGRVSVLGEQLGRVDVRDLRRRVGYASAALARQFRPELTTTDVVVTAKFAALEPWWHRYEKDDIEQAQACLDRMGVASLAARSIGSLSSGEQQRVFLARTLMNDPGVVVLDEPAAGLDLGGREQLVTALQDLAAQVDGPPIVLVTHHVDEIPHGITHALLLRAGRAVASGPLDHALTSRTLSDCFGMSLALERRPDGRLSAWSRHAQA